ncbi:MAG: ribosomal protein L7/L12 [Planctomycetota bacterium]|jgi:ribosomal protein L7/L12
MNPPIDKEIRELLDAGNKIAAVKRLREETGIGLAEAKAVVEAFEASEPLAERTMTPDSDLTDQVIRLLERGEMIQAVKLHREQTGAGLKEAKEAVEQIGEQHGIPASSGAGCLSLVLLCLTLSIVAGVMTLGAH